jgi:hypothetical protein
MKEWVILSVTISVMIQCNEWAFFLSQLSIKLIFHDTVIFSGDTQFGKHCRYDHKLCRVNNSSSIFRHKKLFIAHSIPSFVREMLFVSLVLVIFLRSASSKFHSVSDCDDRYSNCAVVYCNREANWTVAEEKAPEKCIDPEELTEKFEEISFVRASDFLNDSSTGKFIRELESKHDSIQRKVLAEQQLSHLMEHKLQLIVNGIWLEHNAKDSLFPIVSTRNSTENELEVFFLDCSLADINLQFLDLFDFTSSVVFWFYVAEGIGLIVLVWNSHKKRRMPKRHYWRYPRFNCFYFSWTFTYRLDILLFANIFCRLFEFLHQCDLDFTVFVRVSKSFGEQDQI